MSEAADLLMPKLGLTMTEGAVAQWRVAAGERFAAGDVVVIIETDKIAHEVEAPANGEMLEVLCDEGAVVPVGTPIGRWSLSRSAPERAPAAVSPALAPRAELVTVGAPAVRGEGAEDARVPATPYARRLAREAGLDLKLIAGSGPRGRIKGADVLRAQAAARTDATQRVTQKSVGPIRHDFAGTSFTAMDVDVSSLEELLVRLREDPTSLARLPACIVLAAIKALAGTSGRMVHLGLEQEGRLVGVEGHVGDRLSSLASRLAHADDDAAHGELALFIIEAKTHLFVPALPPGWSMALGAAGIRPSLIKGTSGAYLSLTLVYDAAAIDHAAASDILARVAALLEEPLHLLAC